MKSVLLNKDSANKKIVGFVFMVLLTGIYQEQGCSAKLTVDSVIYQDIDIIILYTSGGGVYTHDCNANQWNVRAQSSDRTSHMYSTLMAVLRSQICCRVT